MTKSTVPRTDYQKIAGYYDKVRSMPIDVWLSKIIEYGKITANCTILDVGCGTGRFPIGISTRKNCVVCALDPSLEMLKQAVSKDNSRDILWVQGDGQRLPFRDASFNCVYMTLVIHHIENKEMALQEIYRVLKKSGNCVIMTNSHARIKKHILHDFPGVTSIDLKRFPPLPSLKKAMEKIGFRVHLHSVQCEETMPTNEYLERVRNKYISTLTLLSERAFQRGFKIFQQRVQKKYGAYVKRITGFDFVIGEKR